MEENDLTTTAKALLNVNQRLQKVENGGSTGGGYTPPVNPAVPDSGVNVDPGTSLTGMKQVWTGSTKPNQEDKLTLDSSISKNLDNVGDGLQFVFKIVKTPISKGVQGDTVDLTPIATTSTTPVSGKYVCSVPVPISIKKGSFTVGSTLTVKLDGIGEGLSGVTVSLAPEVQLTLSSDGTIGVKPIQGYAFDKLTSGNTGAYYDIVITSVNTYTVGVEVTPLANGTVLWSGSQTVPGGDIVLSSSLRSDWANVGDGIKISLSDPTWGESTWSTAKAWEPNPVTISKTDLIAGKQVSFASQSATYTYSGNDAYKGTTEKTETPAQLKVTVGTGKLTATISAMIVTGSMQAHYSLPFNVLKVTTYLD